MSKAAGVVAAVAVGLGVVVYGAVQIAGYTVPRVSGAASATAEPSKPQAPARDPYAEASGILTVTADAPVTLWDSKQALQDATKAAARRDRQRFGELFRAHGRDLPRGTKVQLVTGGLGAVEVIELDGERRRGWVSRDHLR